MTATSKPRSGKHLRWLRDELSTLADEDVLDEPAIGRLRAFYALDALPEPRNLSLLIFGVMGAALFGAGVILILAHNWAELPRAARAGISLGLLSVAQGVAGWVLATRPTSPAWTEASALILTLFTGAALALISQTYHIEGELGDFLLTWLVLVVPVFYLLRARVAAALCFALAIGIPNTHAQLLNRDLAYLALTAACLPYLYLVRLHQPDQARTALLGWAAAVSVPCGLMFVIHDALGAADAAGMLFFSALFAAMLAFGTEAEPEPPCFSGPLSTVGLLGVAGMALALGFESGWPWKGFADFQADLREPGVAPLLLISALLALHPLSRIRAAARAKRLSLAVAMALPLVSMLGAAMPSADLAIVLGNLYAFSLGMAFVLSGLESLQLRRTNVGLLLLALLFSLRFVDSELSLLTRGFGMMTVGLAFAGVNVWLVRRQARSVRDSARGDS